MKLSDPAAQSAIASGWLSAKPWAIGILAGVIVLSLGEGAVDNKTYLDGLSSHWILWTASSLASLIGGTVARAGQKLRAINSGAVDAAITAKYNAQPPPPSAAPPPGP